MTLNQLYEDLNFWYAMSNSWERQTAFPERAPRSGLCELAYNLCEQDETWVWRNWDCVIAEDPIISRCLKRASRIVRPCNRREHDYWWPIFLFAPRAKAIKAMIQDTESRIAEKERTQR